MAITPRPGATSADAFIDGASALSAHDSPDNAPKRVRKGNKVQISVTLDEDLLDALTADAKRLGISRAALMTIACREAITRGVSLGR